jgi:ribosomal protein S6--L-glutamate ligase
MDTINTIVGWKEWVALPDLGLGAIKAKVDTGAATSSLHAYNIEYFTKNGERYVKFEVHPIQKNKRINKYCIAPLLERRQVKSSTGEQQKRPVISTMLKIGNQFWKIELNLTNRDSMGMRMLIGREALNGRALVNPTHKFLHGKYGPKAIKEIYRK